MVGPSSTVIPWTFQPRCVKLPSLLAVQGVVKEPPVADEGRGAGRQDPPPPAPRMARDAIPPAVAPQAVPPREPAWARPAPARIQGSPAPAASARRGPSPTELQQ